MANDPANPATAFEQGDLVRDVPSSLMERLGRVLRPQPGDPLEQAITEHHLQRIDQAQMYKRNMNTAGMALFQDNQLRQQNPNHPNLLSDADRSSFENQFNEARDQYEKITGVNKDIKGAHAKARGIVDQLIARPDPRGMPPPPSPQYGSTVMEGGVTQTPLPQPPITPEGTALSGRNQSLISNAAGTNWTTPPAQTPTPGGFSLPPEVTLPFQRQQLIFDQQLGQQLETKTRMHDAQVGQWTNEAKQIFNDPNLTSTAAKRYALTGTFGASSHLQLKPIEFTDENGKIQRVMANYDPGEGTATTLDGREIKNPQIADKPQLIKYLKTDANGKPHLIGGFMVGTQLMDDQGRPLPPNTEFYSRGLFGRDTLRQIITIGPNGQQQINTLESVANPTFSKAVWGDEPPPSATPVSPAAAAQRPSGTAPTTPGAATPPTTALQPKRSGGPQVTGSGAPVARQGTGGGAKTTDALGRPLGMTGSMYNTQSAIVRPIREATNQIFGDPTQPDMKSMKDFSKLADDPEARARLSKAFQITFSGLKNDETKSGGLWNLIQTYGGMPQALASAKASVREDVIGTLKGHPDEMEAYDTTMNAYGSQVGMRAINKGTATDTSITKLEQELPLIGLNSMSSDQYKDQLSRLAENVYGASRTLSDTVMPKEEKEYIKAQVSSLKKKGGGERQGGLKAAPTAGGPPKTANEYLSNLGIKPKQ